MTMEVATQNRQDRKALVARLWPGAATFPRPLLAGGGHAPILCYHSVHPVYDGPIDPLSPVRFEEHLHFLKSAYTPIALEQLVMSLRTGAPLPPNPVVLTFDDGYRDNYEVVFPLLRKHRVPATIYLVSDFIAGRITMSEDRNWDALRPEWIREMDASGLVSFGAHTCSHALLSSLPDAQARREVRESKDAVEQVLGHAITEFAYPNGRGRDISRAAIAEVEASGFTSACSTIWGTHHTARDLYWLNRVMITSFDTADVLAQKAAGKYDYLHYVHTTDAWWQGKTAGLGMKAAR